MLDINFIRNNKELVEKSAKEKNYKGVKIDEVIKLDDERKAILQDVEALRKERNETAAKMKGGKPTPELIAKGKEIKDNLAIEEAKLTEVETKVKDALKTIPNIILDDVPLGPEENSVEVAVWGEKKKKVLIISTTLFLATGSTLTVALKLPVLNSIMLKAASH